MSTLSLSTIAFHEKCPKAKLQGIENLFPGVIFPSRGITFLYGHRNNAVPHLLSLSGELGRDAALIEVNVKIGKWLRQRVDLSNSPESGISSTRFLNLARANFDLIDKVFSVWVKHLDPAADPEWPRGSTSNPWVLDHLIEEREFSHLAVIAYQVNAPDVGVFQCATVFDCEAIDVIDGGWCPLKTCTHAESGCNSTASDRV